MNALLTSSRVCNRHLLPAVCFSRAQMHYYLNRDPVASPRQVPPKDLSDDEKKSIASLYHSFCTTQPSRGYIDPKLNSVTLVQSYRDLAHDQFRAWSQTFTPTPTGYECFGYPIETSSIMYSKPSPSGKYLLTIRGVEKGSLLETTPGSAAPTPSGYVPTHPATSTGKCMVLELFTKEGLVASINCGVKHGKVFTGVPFGDPCWSPDESMFVYCAEKVIPASKTVNWFSGIYDTNCTPTPTTPATSTPGNREGPHKYTDTWGEQLNGTVNPTLFAFYLDTQSIHPIQGLPDSSVMTCAQPCIVPSTDSADTWSLVFTGFPVQPRRYGLIYYNSRPAYLFACKVPKHVHTSRVDKPCTKTEQQEVEKLAETATGAPESPAACEVVCLTPDEVSSQNPIAFTYNDVWYVVYLSTNLSTTDPMVHCTTSALRILPLQQGLSKIILQATFQTQYQACLPQDSTTQQGGYDFSWVFTSQLSTPVSPYTLVGVPMKVTDTTGSTNTDTTHSLPGLYLGVSDTHRCILPGVLVLNTQVRSVTQVYMLDLRKNLQNFPNPEISQIVYKLSIPDHIPYDAKTSSVYVLSVEKEYMLVNVSHIAHPPSTYLVHIDTLPSLTTTTTNDQGLCITQDTTRACTIPVHGEVHGVWTKITQAKSINPVSTTLTTYTPRTAHEALPNTVTNILQIPHIDENPVKSSLRESLLAMKGTKSTSEAILSYIPQNTTNNNDLPKGIILFPHGGPHSGFDTAYDFASAVFLAKGYAVIKVNYRGSVGFGQDDLTKLPGQCGIMDINDCMLSLLASYYQIAKNTLDVKSNTNTNNTTFMLEENTGVTLTSELEAVLAQLDRIPVHVYGGSHGGYIAAHLAGQYPSFFHSTVMRNPVLAMTYTSGTSDIPDWCYVESGQAFNSNNFATREAMMKFYDASPYKYLPTYITPTMLQIGTNDQRVPPAQSYEFYKTLQTNGVSSSLLTYYNAQHGLNDRTHIHADSVVSATAWFERFNQNPVLEQKWSTVRF